MGVGGWVDVALEGGNRDGDSSHAAGFPTPPSHPNDRDNTLTHDYSLLLDDRMRFRGQQGERR